MRPFSPCPWSVRALIAMTAAVTTANAVAAPPAEVLDSPFAPDTQAARRDGVLSLRYEAAGYAPLRQAWEQREPVTLRGFHLPGRQLDVKLQPLRVIPDGFRAQVVDATGTRMVTPRVATFSGRLDGRDSYVFLAVTPDRVNGYVYESGTTTWVISSGDPKQPPGRVVIADLATMPAIGAADPWVCRVPELIDAGVGEPSPEAGLHVEGPQVRIADMFIEGDQQFRGLFATAEDAADYAVTLVSATSDVYRRDLGAPMRIPDGYVRIWEVVPPWGVVNTFSDIENFKAYWRSAANPQQDLPRTSVHLWTAPVFGGIAGGFGGICSQEAGYQLSSVNGFFPFPTEHTSSLNWDLYVVSHEFGHSYGSVHTFNYDPPIDCFEGSGPDNGTIMSYCHQQSGGVVNVGMRFHERVQLAIRSYLGGLDCMEVIDVTPGDYDYDGDLDLLDLEACDTCVNLGFASAGCLEMFDLDDNGALTACDYAILEATVDPQVPAQDCNNNNLLDSCEDCDGNGLADECDIATAIDADCNGNGVLDSCEAAWLGDCNTNSTPDFCDIVTGTSLDADANGVPDECQQTLGVPGSFATIQAAIDAAAPGDTVVLADGVYTGAGNRDLDTGGKLVTVRSANGPDNCIIDAGGAARGFIFLGGETSVTRIEGLTIQSGSASVGAGILCDLGSSPTIAGCVIKQCLTTAGGNGGGIACLGGSAPVIVDCTVDSNFADVHGGGLYCLESDPVVRNTLFRLNASFGDGAGMHCRLSHPTVTDCTFEANFGTAGGGVSCAVSSTPRISRCVFASNTASTGAGLHARASQPDVNNCLFVDNSATSGGGGVWLNLSSNVVLRNSTFVDNRSTGGVGHQVSLVSGTTTIIDSILHTDEPGPAVSGSNFAIAYVRYSNVSGGEAVVVMDAPNSVVWGVGNIDETPLFVDAAGGDYRLAEGSPSIDTGDPDFSPATGETDLDGDARLVDGDGDATARVDMGAYELQSGCGGDVDGDNVIGINDFLALLAAWGPNPGNPSDIDGDGTVGINDFLALLAAWGPCA